MNSLNQQVAIQVKNLQFGWPESHPIFDQVSFTLNSGEKLLIHGPSGCGKSTFLNLLAGVVLPSSGEIWINQQPFHQLNQPSKDQLRGEEMGFIFQQFNLISYLSVEENILLPAYLFDRRRQATLEEFDSFDNAVSSYMKRLGLPQELRHHPSHHLSIGQQQRVAAARAFIGKPKIVIADEPTSSLDWNNQVQLMDLFFSLADEQNTALLMVSHDLRLNERFDSQLSFSEFVR